MRFHSVRHALRWYARAVQHDGCKAVWPDPTKIGTAPGARLDFLERLLTLWAVWRCLEQLTPPQRTILALYHIQELPVIHIAARWNRHPSRVYAVLARAAERMTVELQGEDLLEPHDTGLG